MSKKILITGVSKGLGYELSKRYSDEGHTVAGCSRSGSGPDSLAICSAVDVSDFSSVTAFAKEFADKIGAPDLILNNAAVMNEPVDLWDIEPNDFQQLMNINVVGSFNIIKAFYPMMNGRGVIVNLSSGWGRGTSPKVAPYCASKFAIEGMSMAMAQEVPKGMAVVSLNPGFIDTTMVQGVFGKASGAESVGSWADKACSFIMNISAKDNGSQMTVA